jgi:hypothetical protein
VEEDDVYDEPIVTRLSRCDEQTALGAQTWLEVASVAYLCGRLRVEPP